MKMTIVFILLVLSGCATYAHNSEVVVEGDAPVWSGVAGLLRAIEDTYAVDTGDVRLRIYTSDLTIRHTRYPYRERPELTGLFEGYADGSEVHVVHFTDATTADILVHELVQHFVPYTLSAHADSNHAHSIYWIGEAQRMKEKLR